MKRLIWIATAILTAAGLWASPIGPAAAAPVEALDASASVTSPQQAVSPASLAVFDVTVSLAGPLPADVRLVNQIAGGTIETANSEVSACGTTAEINPTGDTFTCSIALEPNETASLRFVARSGLLAQQLTDTATASLQGDDTVLGIDLEGDNDSASHSLPVTSAGSFSYVPEGGSLGFSANAQDHVLRVVKAEGAGGGAIVSLTDPGSMQCGAETCNGVRVVYYGGESGAPFEALTQLDSSGYHDPCRGLGTDKCTGIFWRKQATDQMAPLPPCGLELPGDPCLVSKYKEGPAGKIHYVTAMDSDDPDIGMPGIPSAGGKL